MTDATQPSGHSHWKAVISDGSGSTRVVYLTGDSISIGRELDNDIAIDDLGVSRHHARLLRLGEDLTIEDLKSSNGTLVNGVAIDKPHIIRENDVISLGSVILKIEDVRQRIPQARIQTRVHAIRSVVKSRTWWPWLVAGGIFAVLIVILVALITGGWIIVGRGSTIADAPTTATVTLDVPTIALTQAPADNSQVRVNQSVTIQAIASDPAGLIRMELWVNDRKFDEVTSSLAQNAPSMAAAFQWTPESSGTYILEVRAYNRRGLGGILPVATLTAFGDTPSPTPSPTLEPTPTPTPTPTITPRPPTSTPTSTPSPTPVPSTPTPARVWLAVRVSALNVRTGPGTQYSSVGQLRENERAEIIGQATGTQGQWWQIKFPAASTGLGWVSANPSFVSVASTGAVPIVAIPPLPTPTAASVPTPTPTATTATATIIRPPAGKTLLIISNRSALNQPARLTLSGGKSVGGGKEFDPPANGEITVVLEPDFYRALWSTPARGGFSRGADFTAIAGKVMVMWIVPEEGLTDTEVYDQLIVSGSSSLTSHLISSSAHVAMSGGHSASPGKALLIAANRSGLNNFAVLTLAGGNFAGGQQFTLDANTETPLDMLPGSYRALWHSPAKGGFNAGRDFKVSAGEVVQSWIIPEDGQVFMQFPGQSPLQINN